MATLILTAVGTALGGPLGGALGALAGRQVDQAIFGTGRVAGPRIKDLSVQTSSYGTPLPRHYGTMRAAGTVIWSTDLVEHRESRSTGKGRPSVTTYAYTASFAVALASRPIAGIGRIWADGNLLRGSAGDLKVGGSMRVHLGWGDQGPDPLIAQSESLANSPAFRHCAYVVFEDLELANFGNRLPSLTFEVLGDTGPISLASILSDLMPLAQTRDLGTQLIGFSADQGSIADTIATISEAIPIACMSDVEGLVFASTEGGSSIVPTLPPPAASLDEEAQLARAGGWSRRREPAPRTFQCAVRYYDPARDYQIGLQRSAGRAGNGEITVIDLPAAMTTDDARAIANAAGRRLSRPTDTISYRVNEIGPGLAPGVHVRVPIADGIWRVDQWEWQKDGLLLTLRTSGKTAAVAADAASDAGRANTADDLVAGPTSLDAFELPWDGTGDDTTPAVFAAATAESRAWAGASLFADLDGTGASLVPVGQTGRTRATTGTISEALAASSPHLVDRTSVIEVQLHAQDQSLPTSTLQRLLLGENRAMIGSEMIQFARAEPAGEGLWRLSGILRGRGGTEWAISTHRADEPFVLIDDALLRMDPALVGDTSHLHMVAIGLGDSTPVRTPIRMPGATLQPLSPVHGLIRIEPDGSLRITWVRRARGAWTWQNETDAPLNEEAELYDISFGDRDLPILRWSVSVPQLEITAAQATTLAESTAPHLFHVRQIGRGIPSRPLTLPLPS